MDNKPQFTPGALLELAERCEAATENDWSLFHECHRATFPRPERIDDTWATNRGRFVRLLDAGAYVDAALTLVPEGWHFSATSSDFGATADVFQQGIINRRRGEAATLALAICAAALRARAAALRARAAA